MMSLHKLTAGHGYDYLTRQVAALDSTEKGHLGLASYYTAKGETPGVWVGSGMVGLDGLDVGDEVTAEQMQALFGSGHHPLAQQRAQRLGDAASVEQAQAAVRLGSPFHIYDHDVSRFQVEVAQRLAKLNTDHHLPSRAQHNAQVRATVRTQVGHDLFLADYGREPLNERELAGYIATVSRQQTTAVAGYDLTFSPVKSVSALWALADQPTAAVIEQAHQAAIGDALRFIEDNALFTRTGRRGVQQVDVRGLVATAFTHRDSRAGDPDLHTHVAVANKVQTLDGRWLSIDGRVLYKATVAASETYNTALEGHLQQRLGLRFADRPQADASKRPIREVVGVELALVQRWSQRRSSINERRGELATEFQRHHGRPPTMVESLALAQQATLETREAKHEPRSLAQQRGTWRAEAEHQLGRAGVASMLHAALHQAPARVGAELSPRWIDTAAQDVIATVEGSRAVWQRWHVQAEAQRRVRAAELPLSFAREAVERIVGQALERHCVALTKPAQTVAEPKILRRRDGASVYSVAGAQQFTSARIVAAERRLVATAGLTGGRIVSDAAVSVALLEAAANRAELNDGQVALVRQMAQSGARLQLAIAPAGSGKTTAMRALATAWSDHDGQVIGLAPSAAAAAALGDQIGHHADTLAKLVHSISTGTLPAWAAAIGPQTLVVIDEAGMADTLSLDTVVDFVVRRGGSVRLVGDDQQLAAIGAGGVLRDIRSRHGALELNDLLRFDDAAEGAAGLALREGRSEAVGFYLDQRRVHVGDLDTITHDVFNAWLTDRAGGRDALMLAPTRELVAELNKRARHHRLGDTQPAGEVLLGDGSHASVGDLIITRTNRRDLRISATDWVKNGDRWTITNVGGAGVITARHCTSGRQVRLPADYVKESVDLGYACTIHTAQGVTVDTMHGVADSSMTRQHLYTMLTRGRSANHVYLEVVGDGDPHSLIRPEAVLPPTATDLLLGILRRDGAATSAGSELERLSSPTHQLGELAGQYADAVRVAAHDTLPEGHQRAIEDRAHALDSRIVTSEAWPALRSHLALIAAAGGNPIASLTEACSQRELHSADDPAAVLEWRINAVQQLPDGPLPWLPAIPESLAQHRTWGPYLKDLATRTQAAADQVRDQSVGEPVPWLLPGMPRPAESVVAEVAVWRAAYRVADNDLRPTGPTQLPVAEADHQRRLTAAASQTLRGVIDHWRDTIHALITGSCSEGTPRPDPFAADPFAPLLCYRLSQISSTGLDAAGLLRAAASEGPLPDDLPASALWWRICRRISPAVARDASSTPVEHHDYAAQLTELIGIERTTGLQQSTCWPSLVAVLDAARRRGWDLDHLVPTQPAASGVDEAESWLWRISLLLDPIPEPEHAELEPEENPAPEDLHSVTADSDCTPAAGRYAPHRDAPPSQDSPPPLLEQDWVSEPNPFHTGIDLPWPAATDTSPSTDDSHVVVEEDNLAVEAMLRRGLPAPELSDAEVVRQMSRADAWRDTPRSPSRLQQVNQMAADFYAACYRGSWAQSYLQDRFGIDPAGLPGIQVGYAPKGWTALVTQLRRLGVTDDEMLTAGLASTARTGRLIDRFRDRTVFAITHEGATLGFVGRRHPDHSDLDNAGSKYLNTTDTPLFHKGAQMFVADPALIDAGAVPVLVEGPADAIAVTIAGDGRYVGVAPLGTSLTDEQARQLHSWGRPVIVATDNDTAGQTSAQRDFWILSTHQVPSLHAALPEGSDPADLLAARRADHLITALDHATNLGSMLISERLTHLPLPEAVLQAAQIIAALPADEWEPAIAHLEHRTSVPASILRMAVKPHAAAWNRDPTPSMERQLRAITAVQRRLASSAAHAKWHTLTDRIDPALRSSPGWPALAAALDALSATGLHVADTVAIALEDGPLSKRDAAGDLTTRLSQFHPEPPGAADHPGTTSPALSPPTQGITPGVDR